MLLQHTEQTALGEGLGEDIVHAVGKVGHNVVGSRVRSHTDNGRHGIKLANLRRCRHSIQLGHHDILIYTEIESRRLVAMQGREKSYM